MRLRCPLLALESRKGTEEDLVIIIILIPETEKENKKAHEVVLGIGKREVILGLEDAGTCSSLGGSEDCGEEWLSVCLASCRAW